MWKCEYLYVCLFNKAQCDRWAENETDTIQCQRAEKFGFISRHNRVPKWKPHHPPSAGKNIQFLSRWTGTGEKTHFSALTLALPYFIFSIFTKNIAFLLLFQVIGIRDVSSIYEVPILMQTQSIVKLFNAKLNLDIMNRAESPNFMSRWRNLAARWRSNLSIDIDNQNLCRNKEVDFAAEHTFICK